MFSKALAFTLKMLLFSLLLILVAYSMCRIFPVDKPLEPDSVLVSAETLPVIVIDPGHGGVDGGAVGITGICEKELNLKIARILRDIFAVSGYQTVMTRTDDVSVESSENYSGRKKSDLAGRVEIAESYENAIFVSIHMNSYPSSSLSGLQVYYSSNNHASKQYADAVQSAVKLNLQPGNERVTKRAGSNIYVLHNLEIPAFMIECGFISNYAECEELTDSEYQKKLAGVIFSAISNAIYDGEIG